jgi:hypothetical protein
MHAARLWILAGALAGAGCLDGSGMHARAGDVDETAADDWPLVMIESGELVLDCAQAEAPDVHVLFECDSVTIYACDEMSDAVLEYESGRRQRFTRLGGQLVTLAARGVHDGQRIVSVRLPGDGSDRLAATGGERRIAAPADSCGAAIGPTPAAAPVPAVLPAR